VGEESSRLESRLGERLSILFRIEGDPGHGFSEVTGLLQRVVVGEDGQRVLHVCRRDGSVVGVAEADIVRLKFIPPATGPLRRFPSGAG
jgi:hypothetical protein